MPKLNLRHNLPLFVALLAVTAAVPLTVFVALTQTQLKSKAEHKPISYASNELKVTEIGTIIKASGIGRIKNSAKMAFTPQNEGKVLGFATPPAITITPTPTCTPDYTTCVPGKNGRDQNCGGATPDGNGWYCPLPPPETTFLLQTEDGRTYHFNYNPYDNMDQFVNKTVLVEGTMSQDVGTKCFPNDSGGQFCYTASLLPWWPLPNYLGIDVTNIIEATKTHSLITSLGILKKTDDWSFQFNLFELDTSLLCKTTPCILPLWPSSPSTPSPMPYWYNPLQVRSSFEDLSSYLGYQIEISGDEYSLNYNVNEGPARRIFNVKSLKQLTFNKPETKLSFLNNEMQIAPNTELLTSIIMDTGQNKVTSVDFQLYFDPSRIQLLSIAPNSGYFPQILTPSSIDNTYGTARIVVGSGPNKTVNGSNLMVVDIRGRTKNLTGDAWLSFSYGTKVAAYDFKYNVLTQSSPLKINVPNLIPGDLDNNGKVDIFDYNILVQNFGNNSCNNVADIDNNCEVDIFDYNTLVQNFGKTIVQPVQ